MDNTQKQNLSCANVDETTFALICHKLGFNDMSFTQEQRQRIILTRTALLAPIIGNRKIKFLSLADSEIFIKKVCAWYLDIINVEVEEEIKEKVKDEYYPTEDWKNL